MLACPTRTLRDEPTDVDSFGAHSRVAKALAGELLTEEGGRTIGLEGPYGSGKSTVVRLTRNELAVDPSVTVFVFDAWAHQGDPLRRSFLETLLERLNPWIPQDVRERFQKSISGRERRTLSTVERELSLAGKILAGSVLAVPVGTALLTAALRGPDWSGRWEDWAKGIFGILCTAMPLFAVIGLKLATWRGATWAKGGLFTSETTETTVSETHEQPEPTSVEFEGYFRRILDAALGSAERRLVIILDNLDRISGDDARSLWSTLQTFVAPDSTSASSWGRRVWVVLPYDRRGLQQMWSSEGPEGALINESFLDKTFHNRFFVPPPVMSDWHAYLRTLIRDALPVHASNQDHLETIVSIFGTFLRPRSEVTPRLLKTWVNDLGAYHRQWFEELPISDQAYFTCLRRNYGDQLLSVIQQASLPYPELLSILSDELRLNLAALYFGLPPAKAFQVMLREPIMSALSQPTTEPLTNLERLYGDGFWIVLATSVEAELLAWEQSTQLARAAFLLDESKLLAGSDLDGYKRRVLRKLRDATLSIKSLIPI